MPLESLVEDIVFSYNHKLPAAIFTVLGRSLPFRFVYSVGHHFLDVLFGHTLLGFWSHCLGLWLYLENPTLQHPLLVFRLDVEVGEVSVPAVIHGR